MERRLAAVLAGDVVGYSRLMAADETGTYEALRSGLADVVTPTLERNDGRLVKTTGDGFLACFASVGAALRAAIEIQDGFAERPPLTWRLGLNLGDVIAEDGDVFGDGVNVASRLESMAEPGGIYVSQSVVRGVGKVPGVRFDRLGFRRAKTLDEPVEVYAVRRGADAARRAFPRRPAVAAAALLVFAAVGGGLWTYRDALAPVVESGPERRAAADADARPTVAVLPFDNLSGDPSQDYFSDGLTEDVIADLAQGDELQVIARNSTFVYKDRPADIRAVGDELGAGYVVEGSARRQGDRLRVVAQLIAADTGAHLWSQSYDRRVEDVFAVQTDLTTRIVASLTSYVGRSEAEAARGRPTSSLRAYDLVLRGNALYQHSSNDARALLAARELYLRAVALDPNYAAARVSLGKTHIVDHVNRLTGPPDRRDLEIGLDQVREAIRLQPDSAMAYQVLSYGLAESGDYPGALRAARRSVELNASDPDSLMALAKAELRFGAYEDAAANAARAMRLHPFAPRYYPYILGAALYAAGRDGEADGVLGECLLRAPDERNCLRIHAAVLARLGRVDEARAALARLISLDPAFSLAAERRTRRFGDSPVMDAYLADLKAAGAPAAAGQARRADDRDPPA